MPPPLHCCSVPKRIIQILLLFGICFLVSTLAVICDHPATGIPLRSRLRLLLLLRRDGCDISPQHNNYGWWTRISRGGGNTNAIANADADANTVPNTTADANAGAVTMMNATTITNDEEDDDGGGGGGSVLDTTTGSNETIGGGAINEKERNYGRDSSHRKGGGTSESKLKSKSSSTRSGFDPSRHRSHLLHAMEGLNRYPNYLSRWNEHDADALETELEQTLGRVREQKSKIAAQRNAIELVLEEFFQQHPEWKEFATAPGSWEDVRNDVLDPRAANAIFRSRVFRCKKSKGSGKSNGNDNDIVSLVDVLSGRVPIELDTGYLQEWMDEELFDVYSFPLLSKTFCQKLCRYASAAMAFIESSPRASGEEGAIIRGFATKNLDLLGMTWLNDLVFHLVVKPVSAQLYKDTELEGGELDWRHGFIAAYSSDPTSSKPRQRLVPHTDDAEVTLNLCFGDQFTGGDLHFWGIRGDQTAGTFVGEYRPEVGRAVLHSGRHLHEVTEITSGNRFAYIQWARSWGATRKDVCPCCWLNRREPNGRDCCVCGKRWN